MFIDKAQNCLFTINLNTEEDLQFVISDDKNIIKYPIHIGLTAKSIKTKKLIKSEKGQQESGYVNEIDNYLNVHKVNNLLIGPMIDRAGEVQGVI